MNQNPPFPAGPYSLLAIHRPGIESGSATACEHCGRAIVNTATIATSQGQHLTVGLDCLKTLMKQKPLKNPQQAEDLLYDFQACLRFMVAYEKADTIVDNGLFVSVTYRLNDKPRSAMGYHHLLRQFGFVLTRKPTQTDGSV